MPDETTPPRDPRYPATRSQTTPLSLEDFRQARLDWQSFETRTRLVARLALAAQVLLAMHIIGLLPAMFETRAWQIGANIGLSAAGGALSYLAYRLANRGKLTRAGTVLLFVLFFSPFANVLFIGNNLLFGAASLAALAVTLYAVWPERWRTGLLTLVLYAPYYYLVTLLIPIDRYDLANAPTAAAVDLINTLALLAVLTVFGIQSIRRGSLRTRLLLTFSLLTLIPLATTGAVSVLLTRWDTSNRTQARIANIADNRVQAINAWVQDLHTNLEIEIERDRQHQDIQTLLTTSNESADHWKAYISLRRRFLGTITLRDTFEDIWLLRPNGTVFVSTVGFDGGKDKSAEPFFQEALNGPTLQPMQQTGKDPLGALVVARPIRSNDGRVIGVLAARANRAVLDNLLQAPAGGNPSTEIVLIGAEGRLLTRSDGVAAQDAAFPVGAILPANEGMQHVLQNEQSGQGQYRNYRGVPVIAAYRWIPALQAGLLAEVASADALGVARTVTIANISLALITVIVAFSVGLTVARNLSNPVAELTRTAQAVSGGDLQAQAAIELGDELGELGSAFNIMTAQLRGRIVDLERRLAGHTHDLEHITQQLQTAAGIVAELTPAGLPAAQPDVEGSRQGDPLRETLAGSVDLIRRRLDFVHVALFLADAQSDKLALVMAGSPSGRGSEEQQVDSSEAAEREWTLEALHDLPLQPGAFAQRTVLIETTSADKRRILGALNVQSEQPEAFSLQAELTLKMMADQLGAQIQNARLISELIQQVNELEIAYGKFTRTGWQHLLQQSAGPLGYRYRSGAVRPIRQRRPEAVQAWQSGRTVETPLTQPAGETTQTSTALAVPIQLRGQVIGVLNLRLAKGEAADDLLPLAEEAAARLALALDNARLLLEAQQRAAREELVAQATGRLRESLDIDLVLKNAVRELGQSLGLAEVVIELTPEESGPAGSGNGQALSAPAGGKE